MSHASSNPSPNLFQRMTLGLKVMMRGGLAQAAAHFEMVESARSSKVTQPYRQIAPVRAAVSRKAKALASMPLLIATASDQIIESGPLFDLIDQPNARMSRVDFWQTTSAWLDLSGACHWVMPPEKRIGNRPTEIFPVSAWQMKPHIDKATKALIGWRYRPAGFGWHEAIDLELEDVWTVGEDTFDPTDPFGYSSPLESAAKAVSQLFKADVANEASLDNGVEPGGAFTMPGTPTDEQVNEMKRDLLEHHAGVANRRRHMLLYGGMEWKQIAATYDEMEFSTLQKMKIVDVCAALEIDPAAIGYVEGGRYEFVKQSKASMWIDTILPRAAWLTDEFSRGIVSRFEDRMQVGWRKAPLVRRQTYADGYRAAKASPLTSRRSLFVFFDDSRIGAIRESMLSRSKEGAIWIDKYKAPPADVIECLDLPLPIHDHQRVGWQGVGEMPILDLTAPGSEDPAGPAPDDLDDPDDSNDLDDHDGLDDPQYDESGKQASRRSVAPDHIRDLSESQRAAMWLAWRASWSGIEKSANNRVRRHWRSLNAITLANLQRVLGDMGDMAEDDTAAGSRSVEPDRRRDVIGEILFDLVEANDALRVLMSPLLRESVRLGGQQSLDEAAIAQGKTADEADIYDVGSQRARDAVRAREIKIAGINKTTRRRLADQLADGLAANESVSKLAERVRREFNLATSRAATIARTEIGAAVEDARQLGREDAQVPHKSWLWSRKETGRPWHMRTEEITFEEPVPNHQDFVIDETGAHTPHPRGPGLSAEDAVNCGCTTISRYPGDQVRDARLIAHLVTHGFTTPGDLNYRMRPERKTPDPITATAGA